MITFTLDYFGKAVAGYQDGNFFTVQISYVTLEMERRQNNEGTVWIDVAQSRQSELSKEIGQLIETQGFSKEADISIIV